jgi:hypothetical protein
MLYIFPVEWSEVEALSSIRSLAKANLKFSWDNFEPQGMRRMKLFRIEKSGGVGGDNFFVHFHVSLLME